MIVKELIEFLQKQQQDLPVAYTCCSNQIMLDSEEISIEELYNAMVYGWVANKRPHKETTLYLVFPGN